MAIGDILSGVSDAYMSHQSRLLEMAREDKKNKAAMFAKLAENPNFAPEQQAWFGKAALAQFDDKEAKKYEIKDGNIQVPVEVLSPRPIPIPQSPGTSGVDASGQPQQAQAGIAARTVQPPQPPPQMRDVMQPRGMDEQLEISRRAAESQRATPVPEPFTLSQGQTRFDPSGNVLATGAVEAPTPPEQFTLTPGQKRFDARGNVIAQVDASVPQDMSVTIPELALRAASGDAKAKGALDEIARMNASQAGAGGGKTLYERLGPDAYYDKIRKESLARANASDAAIDSYVNSVESGSVTNISQVPQALRADVLDRMAQKGAFVISLTDRDAIRKIDMTGHLLERLEFYSRKVSQDPTDYESALILNGLRESVSSIFAKGIFAETGVLTDPDIARVQASIPGIIRSAFVPGVSEKQFAELKEIISRAKKNVGRPIGDVVRGKGGTVTNNPPMQMQGPGTNERVMDFNSLPK